MRPSDVLAMSIQEIANSSIADILSALILIPSVNPQWESRTSGIANELAKAEFLAALFRKLGDLVQVDIDYITPERPNVMVRVKVNEKYWIVWDTHIDTVGVDNMTISPFGGEIRDNKVWGRGACDTLASAAVAIKLLFSNLAKGIMPKQNLLLAFTIGEETGGIGARHLNSWLSRQGLKGKIDRWICTEPTELCPVFAHNGVIRGCFEIQGGQNINFNSATSMCVLIEGQSGHTSDPDAVRTKALYDAALLVQRIDNVDGLHVVAIECGGLGNTIPDSCLIVVEQESRVLGNRNWLKEQVLSLANGNATCLDPDDAHRDACGFSSSAVYTAANLVIAIEAEQQRLKISGHNSVTGRPVMSTTGLIIHGSTGKIFVDRRVVPGETPDTEFLSLLKTMQAQLRHGESLIEAPNFRRQPGFQTSIDSPLVKEMESLTGNEAKTVPFGTNLLSIDIALFPGSMTNAIVFGPGNIAQAHTPNEYIEISQVEKHAKIMAEFLGFK